jgi:hypothetical protein
MCGDQGNAQISWVVNEIIAFISALTSTRKTGLPSFAAHTSVAVFGSSSFSYACAPLQPYWYFIQPRQLSGKHASCTPVSSCGTDRFGGRLSTHTATYAALRLKGTRPRRAHKNEKTHIQVGGTTGFACWLGGIPSYCTKPSTLCQQSKFASLAATANS